MSRWQASFLAAALAATASPAAAAGDPARMPAPPASPKQLFQPDALTCTRSRLLGEASDRLAPFRDQPPAVLEQLRALQQELSLASIRRCLQRGLIQPAEAQAWQEALLNPETSTPPAAAGPSKPVTGAQQRP